MTMRASWTLVEYQGESGALSEHISDVFGKMIALWDENKTSTESDWLIGGKFFMPEIPDVALRNITFPGTAYNDPKVCSSPIQGCVLAIDEWRFTTDY